MKIETGIPVPSEFGGSNLKHARETLERMDVGQSVLVDGKAHHAAAASFRQAAHALGCKVVTRTQPIEDGKRKTRVWKVA